jgi:Phosphate transport regulator (distant homolog of PhoU)
VKKIKQKKDKLFILLSEISANLKDSGKYFVECKFKDENDLDEFQKKMKNYEHKGEGLLDDLIKELNDTFITPIEREDALELGVHMDEVLDGLEQCAAHFYMFNICEVEEYMVELSKLIYKCIEEISEAVDLLTQKKLMKIRKHSIKIKEYEEECDFLERKAIKELFKNQKDVMKLIQFKDVYELLENTADKCQRVAKTLERVVMKNA